MDENAIRSAWKAGASCQIYSNSKKKWFQGEVAQIFTDEEGEWLEIRYDKSMSKQVQRYSSDIRPDPDDLKGKKKRKPKTSSTDSNPFTDAEMKVRQSWGKGDQVEIFSNTHQEWFCGEVVDIIKDDEGEWLTCVWARANNEAMSKQVQRFSTDVRPLGLKDDDESSTESSDSDDGSPSKTTNKYGKSSIKQHSVDSKKQGLADEIAKRIKEGKEGYRRRAPIFSRTLKPSTFSHPATKFVRTAKQLNVLEETPEKNQHVVDSAPIGNKKNANKKRIELETMRGPQIREFIKSLGSAYDKYANKFKNVKGSQLIKCTETHLQKMGIGAKLHRNKILLEIARHSPNNPYQSIFSNEIDVLNWTPFKVEEWCKNTPVLSLYAKRFFNHGVDGMLLFELDTKDLVTIGVQKVHQQRVLDIVTQFAKQNFPAPNDDEKDEEYAKINGLEGLNKAGLNDNGASGKKKRGSVAHIDVAALEQMNGNGGVNIMGENQNNDAIIYTMGELLLELGQMFKVGKVQDLTTRLQEQLRELQRNSNHPQMVKRKSSETDHNGKSSPVTKEATDKLIKKMQDTVDTSPTGVDAAWLKTQNQAKGHKRRSSLPFINANQLENANDNDNDQSSSSEEEEDEDDDDISDIE